jgi:TusA-related sulfurtransferase/DNA-binding HxlR family transcriptional regulator
MRVAFHSLIEEQAQIHQIFSNPWRILIVWVLEKQERSVSEIAEEIGTTLQNTSQHLRLMKDRGMLESRRDGQTIYYRITDGDLGRNCKALLRMFNPNYHNQTTRRFKMSENDLSTIQAAKVVDARAMACPGPLLEAKKSIAGVRVNEVLEIWAGDPNTKNDMPRWCQKVGHEYLGEVLADGYDRLFIRRKK